MGQPLQVLLITTGKLEQAALAASLQLMFDEYGRQLFQTTRDVQFMDSRYQDGFTSTKIQPALIDDEALPRTLAYRLVSELVAGLTPKRRRDPKPELVIAVDDLEVYNLDNIPNVLTLFRRATQRYVNEHSELVSADDVRDKCSFHLLSPMVESYFFADPQALELAAGPGSPPLARLKHNELERFDVSLDADYLTSSLELGEPALRPHHPKHYIKFLRSRVAPSATPYRETHEGAQALQGLSWFEHIFFRPCDEAGAASLPLLRALLEDLIEAAGGHPCWDVINGPTTAQGAPGSVLRNL